jgi:prolyl oligopeptidase PreP (S9A serine peptidase family)
LIANAIFSVSTGVHIEEAGALERQVIASKFNSLRASPTRVQQKFANEQDGTKRMFFVVAGRRAKVLK